MTAPLVLFWYSNSGHNRWSLFSVQNLLMTCFCRMDTWNPHVSKGWKWNGFRISNISPGEKPEMNVVTYYLLKILATLRQWSTQCGCRDNNFAYDGSCFSSVKPISKELMLAALVFFKRLAPSDLCKESSITDWYADFAHACVVSTSNVLDLHDAPTCSSSCKQMEFWGLCCQVTLLQDIPSYRLIRYNVEHRHS